MYIMEYLYFEHALAQNPGDMWRPDYKPPPVKPTLDRQPNALAIAKDPADSWLLVVISCIIAITLIILTVLSFVYHWEDKYKIPFLAFGCASIFVAIMFIANKS